MRRVGMLRLRGTLLSSLVLLLPLLLPPDVRAAPDVLPRLVKSTVQEAREVRTVWTSEFGVSRPAGLAYVPRRGEFLVAESKARRTSILRLDLSADPLGRLRLPRLSSPSTLAFDPARQRLAGLQGPRAISAGLRDIGVERPGVTRRVLDGVGFRDPRATTFDPRSGEWFVLDAATDSVAVMHGIRSRASQRRTISIRALGIVAYGGVALNPSDGLLYVLASDRKIVYGLDRSGAIRKTYGLSSLDLREPVAMTFAQSADLTDDPSTQHLYIADAGDSSRLGGVTEVSFAIEAAAAAEVVTATHVQTIDTSAWNPAAPDPSGVVHLPGPDRLAVVDSEVDEVTGAGYHGVNLWVTRRNGTVTETGTTFPTFSKEPTGLGHDPETDTLFISDDSAKRIWMDTRGNDGLFGTADDVVTSIDAQAYGSGDTEDPEFDPVTGHLFFVDGVNREVYEIDPVNEVFGDADDVMTHFDVGQFGPTDWEGLGSDPSRGTLLVGARTKEIYEVTKSGALVRIIDASNIPDLRRISGLGMAPASDGSGRMNYWIVDRAVDNGADPNENDGKLFEISVSTPGEVPPSVTLTTPVDGSAVNGVVPIEAFATDNLGVTQVEFSIDGVSIGIDTNGTDGWSTAWNTSTAAEAPHAVTATATDTIGQTGSDTNTVTVDRTPPTVSISSPGQGEQVSGTVTLQADASDANGVTQVEFFVGTISIGLGTNGPNGWSIPWDTTGVADGDHVLSAVATDGAGNTTTSPQVTVSVDNAGEPPGATLTLAPIADTFVEDRNPDRNHGGDTTLQVDGSPQKQILMTFSVSGIGAGSVARATLSMDAVDGSRDGGTAHRVADTSWDEMSVTWNSAPAHDATPIGSFGRVSPGNRYAMDVTAIIGGDGAYSIKLVSGHRNGADYVSREGTPGLGPRLEIELLAPADTLPPSTSIAQPLAGSTVSDVTSVDVDATDDVGVVSVDVLVDGASVGSDTSEPYSVAWDTRTATNGDHELVAVALDAAGNPGTSDPVTVTVDNAPDTTPPDPPTNLVATPVSGSRVDLSWDAAADDVGVVSYSVLRDGIEIDTSVLTTYSDATVEPVTSYVYEVTASDAAGNVSDPSAPANVTTPPPDPTSFVFAAGGDHGANANTDASLAQLDASGADFYLALGDLDYNQTATDEAWCDYVKAGLPTLGPTFPFQLVAGNHEEEGSPTGYILNHAACLPDRMGSTPGPGSMYGVEYYFDHPQATPLMRVVMIAPDLTVEGVYHDYAVGTARYQWLAGVIDDARTAGIPWVVVGMHKNCLTAGVKSCEIGADLMNLLVDKKVDLVLQGHDHNYQRGKQLALDASCPGIVVDGYDPDCVVDDGVDDVYAKGAGTVLTIAGAFGQGGYQVSPADAEAPYFSESDDTTNGFVRFAVTDNRIDATFVPSVGSFTDSFSIQSGAIPSADRTPPSVPMDLSASAPVADRVDLSWSPSTDGTGVAGYLVYRDGAYLASSSTTSYSDTSVIADTAYSYSVVALDLANNPSGPSDPANVTTPSGGGTGPLTFLAFADARIQEGAPDNNYGSLTAIAVDASPVQHSLLRFEVAGVGSSTVISAKLRLYNVNRSNSGGEFFLAEHSTWDESTVTWNTAPQALPPMVASLGAVEVGNWYEVDLTSAIGGDGIYTIRVQSSSSNGADYASKEGSPATVPQLVIGLAG